MLTTCMVGLSQKLPVNGFKFGKKVSKIDDEDTDKGYILEVDVKYPKHLQDFHSDLQFLPERMKIDKCNKLVCNLYDKKLCCSYKIIKASINSRANI